MSSVVLVLGPFVALLGVLLGGVLSSRTQRETWRREQDRREREAIRSACAGYVAATRRFISYVRDRNTKIAVVSDPERGGGRTHVLEDLSYHLEVENASAELLLVVRTVETVRHARNLRRTLSQLALARAERPGSALPEELSATRTAEIAFINAARAELGVPALDRGLYHLD
jgi:hypothetical protein